MTETKAAAAAAATAAAAPVFQVVLVGGAAEMLVDREREVEQIVFGNRTTGDVDRQLLLLKDTNLLLLPMEASGGLTADDKKKEQARAARIINDQSSEKDEFDTFKWFWYRASVAKTPTVYYEFRGGGGAGAGSSSSKKVTWVPSTRTIVIPTDADVSSTKLQLWSIIDEQWQRPWRSALERRSIVDKRLSDMSLSAAAVPPREHFSKMSLSAADDDDGEIAAVDDDDDGGDAAMPGGKEEKKAHGTKRKAAADDDDGGGKFRPPEKKSKEDHPIEARRRILMVAGRNTKAVKDLMDGILIELNEDNGDSTASRIQVTAEFVPHPFDVPKIETSESYRSAVLKYATEWKQIHGQDSLEPYEPLQRLVDNKPAAWTQEKRAKLFARAFCRDPFDVVICSIDRPPESLAHTRERQRKLYDFLRPDSPIVNLSGPGFHDQWLRSHWYYNAVVGGLIDSERVIFTVLDPWVTKGTFKRIELNVERNNCIFVPDDEIGAYLSTRWRKGLAAVRDRVYDQIRSDQMARLIADYTISGKSKPVAAIARVQGTNTHLRIPAEHMLYPEQVLVRGKHTLYRLKKRG